MGRGARGRAHLRLGLDTTRHCLAAQTIRPRGPARNAQTGHGSCLTNKYPQLSLSPIGTTTDRPEDPYSAVTPGFKASTREPGTATPYTHRRQAYKAWLKPLGYCQTSALLSIGSLHTTEVRRLGPSADWVRSTLRDVILPFMVPQTASAGTVSGATPGGVFQAFQPKNV